MRQILVILYGCFQVAAHATCFPVAGAQILGSDLARANALFELVSLDQVIGFAPVPGAQRSLTAGDLMRIAIRFHVIGIEQASLAGICFERAVESIDPARIRTAMAGTLGLAEEQIEIADFSHFRTPRGEVEFLRSGLVPAAVNTPDAPAFWRGRVTYDHGRSMAIWAKVKVKVESLIVTAGANIGPGQIIQPDQVSAVSTRQFPVASDVFNTVDQVVGKRARRSIAAGTAIRANLVETPREITQGDVVQVSAGSGQAQITFEAHAQTGGRKGDTILLQNPSSGRSFKAIVIDKARVEVRPSGA